MSRASLNEVSPNLDWIQTILLRGVILNICCFSGYVIALDELGEVRTRLSENKLCKNDVS